MAATMKDVAALAGLSIGTVSNYFSGKVAVSEEKSRRIEKAIEQLHYQLNPVARTLKTNQHHMIGVLIPDFQNVYVVRVISYMEELLQSRGYSMLVVSCHHRDEQQEERLRYLLARVDGILYMPARITPSLQRCVETIRQTVPVVAFNDVVEGVECDHVLVDSAAAVEKAITTLIEKGHRKIGMLAGPREVYTSRQRLAAYRNAFRESGLALDESLVMFGDYSRRTGVRQCRELLEAHPDMTALFSVGYRMTLGALDVLGTTGAKDRVCVVGYDASDLEGIISPKISYVYQPYEEMARVAVELMLRRIAKDMDGFPEAVELTARICNLDALALR